MLTQDDKVTTEFEYYGTLILYQITFTITQGKANDGVERRKAMDATVNY